MREGWQIKTLGEVSVMMADGPFGSNLKKEHYTENREVRIIQLSNIGEDGWREENTKYTTFKHLETIQRSEVFPNDIVIAKMMPAGRAIICPNHEKKFVLSSDAVKVQLKKGINLRFAWYSINSPYFRKQVYENVAGSGRVRTSLTKLKVCKLRLPSLPEQQRIVVILDREFAKIDALKANAEKSLQAAKDLYAEMLNTSLSSQKGWKTKTLDEVCSKISDGTHHSPPNTPSGEYKYITAKNIKPWGLDLTDLTFVSKDIHKEIYSRCNPKKGDVLYIKDGATTGIAIVNPLEEEFSLLSSVALLKPIPTEITSRYLCYAMNSPRMYAFVRERMDGAAITRITLKKIKAFPVSYPAINEQNAIVSRLDDLNDKCNTLQVNYQKTLTLCDDLKQSLLRKAFNGEL